jgi:hypothetical protein
MKTEAEYRVLAFINTYGSNRPIREYRVLERSPSEEYIKVCDVLAKNTEWVESKEFIIVERLIDTKVPLF